ncbi:MAG: shikimate dehydrogenase [Gammaproteobacteria bacterium]|nr:shikimate dehydrogenase [Gammaproteobacteria bacterium]
MDNYGIIGNPVAHSLSPFIHQHFAKQTQQSLLYTPMWVEKNYLSSMLQVFQRSGGKGLNITAPFKEDVVNLVDTLTERARYARAVNTITFLDDGSRVGDNTDGMGFIRDVTLNQKMTLKNKRILILGAGGAARGIIVPILQEQPALLSLLNRTEEKAVQLTREFASLGPIRLANVSQVEAYDVVIKASSNDLSTLPKAILAENSICYDLSYYHQPEFRRWALQQNAAFILNGLGMLVEQAAESFYLWRNVRPAVAPVLALLKQKNAEKPSSR